jgi:hypothetical protein
MATSLMRNLGDDATDAAPQDEFAENQRHIDEYNRAQLKEQGYPSEQSDPNFPVNPKYAPEVPRMNNAKMGVENAPAQQFPVSSTEQSAGHPLGTSSVPRMSPPQSSAMKPLGGEDLPPGQSEQLSPEELKKQGYPDAQSDPNFAVNPKYAPEVPKKEIHPDTKAIIGAQRTMLAKEATDKAAKGDLLGAGNAKIAMNQLMEHVDTDPFKEKEADPYVQGGGPMRPEPNVAAPEANAASAPNPADVTPASTAMVPLGQEKPPMPAYTGTQRIGKGTPGEAELHNDLETQRGHLRNIIATGNETQAAEARLQLARLNEMNPYGSPANHPGALGRIGHIAAKVGNVAGNVLAPEVMANIPGTDLNKQIQVGQAERELKDAAGHDLTVAETAKNRAEANKPPSAEQQLINAQAELRAATTPEAKAAAQAKVNDLTAAMGAGKAAPKDSSPAQQAIDAEAALVAAKATGDPAKITAAQSALDSIVKGAHDVTAVKPETQEQNKLAFQNAIAKVAAEGLPTGPNQLTKSINSSKTLKPEEKAAAEAYMAANPTPATNLEVKVDAGDEANKHALDKHFQGSEVVATMPDGKRVQMSYGQAKELGLDPNNLEKLNSKQAQDNRDKHASMDSTFKTLDTYRTDMKNAKLSSKDRDALRVLTDHAPEATSGLLAGMFDEIPLAGPLGKYGNKLMNGTITSDQYNALSSAAQKLLADYYTAVVDNFAAMKARLGSVGRNPALIQAENITIPLPYIEWNAVAPAFEAKRQTMSGYTSEWPDLYKPSSK